LKFTALGVGIEITVHGEALASASQAALLGGAEQAAAVIPWNRSKIKCGSKYLN